MLEVDEKLAEAAKFSRKELARYIKDNPVPVVRSPERELFIVDKHHFLSVCLQLGVTKVCVEVVRDFSRSTRPLPYEKFWAWMNRSRNAYPYCQFGEGPRDALYLPRDIRGLADDPYRSLAWFVRKSGAFENSDKNFSEFMWANFFRSKKLLAKKGRQGMAEAMAEAARLAQSEEAKDLPGYDKLNLADTRETIKTARKRGKEIQKKLLPDQ